MRPFSERLGNWFPVLVAAALPIAFLPSLVDAFVLPRTAIVIAGACLGTGLALLIPGRPGLGNMRWPLILAAAGAIIAFAFSVSWPLSLAGGYTRYESLPVRLAYLGLLAVPVWLLRTELARTCVVVALVLGAAISSAEAIFQWLGSVPFRPDGNLGNANLLGALIAIALPLAVAQMFRPGRWTPGWWAAAAVMGGGLVASTSRSGAVAALAGCVAVVVFALRGRMAVFAGIAGAGVVGAALVVILVSPLRDLNGDPGPTRIHLYQDGLRMVAARPLTGWGQDATGLVLGRFLTGDWSPGVTFDRLHSGLLDLAATQGLLGVLTLGAVVVVLFRGLWRRRFAGAAPGTKAPAIGPMSVGSIAAACIAYTVWVLFNFDWAPATGVFWLLAGVGWSAVGARTVRDDAPAPESIELRTRRYVERVVGAIALVLVAIAFAVMPVLAEAWYAQGRPDLAVRVDPLQSQYHRALGEALLSQDSRVEGLAELRLAARLGATDPALYVEIGDEELRNNDVTQARADYRMALTIDPYWAPARQRLAGSGGLGTA
jgi:O-antigen ligase